MEGASVGGVSFITTGRHIFTMISSHHISDSMTPLPRHSSSTLHLLFYRSDWEETGDSSAMARFSLTTGWSRGAGTMKGAPRPPTRARLDRKRDPGPAGPSESAAADPASNKSESSLPWIP